MADFSAIPTHALRQDLSDIRDDIAFCMEALKFDVLKDDDGLSIHNRMSQNRHMKQVIEAELGRRQVKGVVQ